MPMIYNEDTGQYEFVSDGVYNGPASMGNSAPNVDPQTLRALGYVPDIAIGTEYVSGAGGNKFTNALDYYKYLYGDGVTQTDVNGETYYKTPNGADAYLPGTTPLTYNPPPSMGSQLALGAIAAMAGAGLMGAGSGGAAAGTAAEGAGGLSLSGATPGLELGSLGNYGGSGLLSEGLGTSVVNGAFPSAAQFGSSLAAAAPGALSFAPSVTPGLELGSLGGYGGTGAVSEGLGTSVVNSAFPAATELAGALPAATGAAGAAGAVSNAASAGSALSRIMDGSATASDWTSVLGNLGATGLGLAGANSQSNALKDVYNQQMSLGAPYRDMLAQSYQPGFSMANQPDFQNALNLGADAVARATSTKANTFDPGAQMEMNKYVSGNLALPALQNYRSQLGTFGQLGTNTAGAAALGQAQSQGGTYNALGYGLGQLTQPDNPFKGLLSQFGKSAFSF